MLSEKKSFSFFKDVRGSLVSGKFVFTVKPVAQYVYAFLDSRLIQDVCQIRE